MSTARWAALVERAVLGSVDVESLPPSPFLDATVNELIDRLESNGRSSFCGHVSTLAQVGDLPDVVASPGDALGCCVPCGGLHRDTDAGRSSQDVYPV